MLSMLWDAYEGKKTSRSRRMVLRWRCSTCLSSTVEISFTSS